MFLLVPSDRPGYHKARISDDNLTIEWPAGTDNAWTEPPWNDLFMPQYEKEFLSARSDYMLSEVRFRKLA